MAVSWAHLAGGAGTALRHGTRLDPRGRAVADLVARDAAAPLTTSAGRLFDAVAALVGVRSRVTYEAQAAIELEALAAAVPLRQAPCYPVSVVDTGDLVVLDPAPLVSTVLDEIERERPAAVIAAGFHRGLAEGAAAVAAGLARARGVGTVALSGGVFQNVRFSTLVEAGLAGEGLRVLVPETIPPNDGGISVGQAAVAATSSRRSAKDTH